MKFEPVQHFLHVEKVLLSNLKTKGGLHIPANVVEKACVFKVLAAGPGFFDVMSGKRVPMSVDVGDYVLVDVQQVLNIAYSGVDCLICPETAVFGLVSFQDTDEVEAD